ncbi:putative polymerase, partial [Rozella allomycis CSF55]
INIKVEISQTLQLFFAHKDLEHEVSLPPKFFGPGLKQILTRSLYMEVEGKFHGQTGYIISVVNIDNISRGVIEDTFGAAKFLIKYKAIVFRPFKNQVLDGKISEVNSVMDSHVSDCGPLRVFISNHGFPDEFTFEPNSNPPYYISEDQTMKLIKDEQVRVKIVNLSVQASEMIALGSIKEDYLGLFM